MVYFVRLTATGHIKIGYSGNVPARMQQLLREHGPIDLLAVIHGRVPVEREHHRRFASLRVAGEWFRPGPFLVEYVASLESCEPVGRVVWQTPDLIPFPVEPPDLAPLPAWLTGTGGAAARGLPLRPPSRR